MVADLLTELLAKALNRRRKSVKSSARPGMAGAPTSRVRASDAPTEHDRAPFR
jgi:hypothetical protein